MQKQENFLLGLLATLLVVIILILASISQLDNQHKNHPETMYELPDGYTNFKLKGERIATFDFEGHHFLVVRGNNCESITQIKD